MAGEHIEVAKCYVTIIPSMSGSQKTITTELTGVTETASKQAGEKSGKTLGQSLSKGLKTTGAIIAGALATATASAVATGKAFVNSAKDVASYGDSVAKNSQKLQLSKTGYQELDYILKRNGISIDSLKGSMLKLTKAAEANDSAFKDLGISQDDLKKMSPEQTLNATIKALQGMEDKEKRTVLASKLLGKAGGTELAPLLNQSAESTEELRKQVHKLGGIMSDEAVDDSEKFVDEMTNVQTSLAGMKRNLMSQFLPGLTQVMSGLSKVFSGDDSGIGQISSGLSSVVTKVSELAPKFLTLFSTIVMNAISGFAPMLPSVVATIFTFITQAITTLTTMIPQLTPVLINGIKGICQALFQALPVIIQALIAMTKELVTWLASGNNVKTLVDGILSLVSTLATNLADALPILLPAIVKIIGEIASSLTDPKNVKMILTSVLYIVGAIVVALVKALPEIGKTIVNLTKNILTTLKNWGGSVKTYVTGLIGNVKTAMVNWINNLKTSFSNGFNNIKTNISNIVVKVKDFVASLITKIAELPKKALSIGKDLVKGLWNGISDKIDWVKDKIKGMGASITKAIKKVFGIASPSKLWRDEVGSMLALGLGEGYSETMKDVKADMVDSMDGLTGNMTASVNAYGVQDGTLNGSNTYNGGAITINVYGAEGQNINDLANVIAVKLEDLTRRKGAVYA